MELALDLQDHDGNVHGQKECFIDKETTVDQLKDKVASVFQINPDYQRLFFNGSRIRANTLHEVGVKDEDTVVVKHSHTDRWTTYLEIVEAFKAETNPDLKNEFAEAAVKEYNVLKKSSFFDAYTALCKEWINVHRPIAKHLDLLPKWIKDAAIQYFMDKFGIPESCITCKDVITGTRSAIHCNVNVGEIAYEYRIKTNHGAGTSTRASHFRLNLIELYIYKLLEAIGTGPRVLFIPYSVGGNRIVYIASEYMSRFRTFEQYSDGMSTSGNFDAVRKLLVQVHFLSVFLGLSDIKTDNFGMDEQLKPIIVDFVSTNYQNIKEKFLERSNCIVELQYTFVDLLQGCKPSDRLKIAQESVNEWGLMAKADEVLKTISEEKKTFGRVELEFSRAPEDLSTYVEDLKANLKDLLDSKVNFEN